MAMDPWQGSSLRCDEQYFCLGSIGNYWLKLYVVLKRLKSNLDTRAREMIGKLGMWV